MDIVRAPWSLNGVGFMHFFWGPKRTDPYSGVEVKGLGGCIIARYDESPVGPYNEILYIPGKQTIGKNRSYFISKIYVDNEASMVSGQANWGIPKELAEIDIKPTSSNVWTIKAQSSDQQKFFKAQFKSVGPGFPISSRIVPIPLLQQWNKHVFLTRFIGSGKAWICSSDYDILNNELFPDITQYTKLITIAVNPFTLTFPIPKVFH